MARPPSGSMPADRVRIAGEVAVAADNDRSGLDRKADPSREFPSRSSGAGSARTSAAPWRWTSGGRAEQVSKHQIYCC